jgi:DNA-binding YbaB/EbfC family protein
MKQMPGLLSKLSQMQKRMEAAQAEIAAMTFEGTAANNLVTVSITGAGELKRVNIDESLKSEDLETLGDLVVVAVGNANAKKEEASKAKLGGLAAGLMPFGMKVPGLG